MSSNALTIGQVAKQAGLGTKAIRFYEGKGLLSPAARGENRYRLYGAEAVDVLRFVKQAQTMGLTLAEIREIIGIRQGGRPPCRHVHALLHQKAEELDRKLQDLIALRRRIRASLKAWGGSAGRRAAVCPHIETPSIRRRVVKQVDLQVTGMSCRACEQRIEKALTRIDGVVQSAADHRAAKVRVMFDPSRISESDVRSCVERSGYTVAP